MGEERKSSKVKPVETWMVGIMVHEPTKKQSGSKTSKRAKEAPKNEVVNS